MQLDIDVKKDATDLAARETETALRAEELAEREKIELKN